MGRNSNSDRAPTRQERWAERNPLKRWAHRAFESALNRGIVTKQPCTVCGSQDAEAHHADYQKPLAVEWLCRKHHKERHAAEREVA